MSKAFTRKLEAEADFEDEIPVLPAGTKNYITPDGRRRLEDEFAQLQKIERPKTVETMSWAAGNGTAPFSAVWIESSYPNGQSVGWINKRTMLSSVLTSVCAPSLPGNIRILSYSGD